MKLKPVIPVIPVLLVFALLLTACGGLFPGRTQSPAATIEVETTAEPEPEDNPDSELAAEATPELTPEPAPVYDLNFTVGGQTLSAATESLDLTQATPEEIDRLITVLPALTGLQSLELGTAAAASPAVSWDQLQAVKEAAPAVSMNGEVLLNGYRFSLSDEVLNLSHMSFSDEGKLALQIASCMPNLRILDMDSCGVPDESMSVIRDSLPGVKVIWRVFFGDAYSTRTDVERLMVSNPDRGYVPLTSEVMKGLYYCTDVKYLDLGHLSYLDDVGYASKMPDLEVLIIAMTAIKDISALADCPKLNYLELQSCGAVDLSPLSGLKQLKDLNICYDFALRDIRPIYDLDLDRLWIGCLTPIPQDQIQEYQSRHPNCWINTTTENPTEEEWRILKDGVAAPRYFQLYDEFLYANFPMCYAYNDNDPYYWRRVDFY